MVDKKNDGKSYAAVVGENDNQPEGTVVGTESQPPPCECRVTFVRMFA